MTGQRLSTRRLFSKFLLVQLPIFALATVAVLALLSLTFLREEQNVLDARVGNMAARVSGVVARAPQGASVRQLEQTVGILMADPAIMCAELSTRGIVEAAAPPKVGCAGQQDYHVLTTRVGASADRLLTVRFSEAELTAVKANKRQFTQMALVVGLLMGTLASWFAFSLFVGRPVTSLLQAIRRSAETGTNETIASPPDDELGTVITAYNAMQQRLGQEASRNREALQQLQHIYDQTPGLMLSLDGEGHVTSVSGHVLDKLGYTRGEMLCNPLTDFLADPEHFAIRNPGAVRDLPLTLRAAGGTTIEVLLSAVEATNPEGGCGHLLCVMSDVTRLNAMSQELRRQAVSDELTGLPNRKGFTDYLAQGAADGSLGREGACVLFIDLDNFKWVNDTHGHEAGDSLLRAAAQRIRGVLAAEDFVARLGGDEFAVVLRAEASRNDAKGTAERIIASMVRPFSIWQTKAHVGCSIGVAGPLSPGRDANELLRLADLAMYRAKQEGRNRAAVYSAELEASTATREAGINRVHTALEQQQLRLFYQPIIELDGLHPRGAEALLRIDAGQTSPSPAEFIRIAEEHGLIGRVGDFVVDTGLSAGSRLIQPGNPGLSYLSINLSPRQLDAAFMASLLERLRADPVLARHMMLEITETALLNDEDRISAFFAEARALGARIALDDFGTGYSSLSHVTRYPVDIIKLDRSFVRNIDSPMLATARRNQALVKAAATLCHELNIQIVAEGIETQGELETLRGFGIRFGQGFLFSRALPEAAFTDWVKAFSPEPAAHDTLARRHAKAV